MRGRHSDVYSLHPLVPLPKNHRDQYHVRSRLSQWEISRFLTLCPDLECIVLQVPPRNSVITDAVSEMVLTCNKNYLRVLQVDSPLTKEALEVVYPFTFSITLNDALSGDTFIAGRPQETCNRAR